MELAINICIVFLGSLAAFLTVFGETHCSTRGLNWRGWTVVVAVVFALGLGIAKEWLVDANEARRDALLDTQHKLMLALMETRKTDHEILMAVLKKIDPNAETRGPEAPTLDVISERLGSSDYLSLMAAREELLTRAQSVVSGEAAAAPVAASSLLQELADSNAKFEAALKGTLKR